MLSDKSKFLETKGCAEKPFYGDGLAVFYVNTNLTSGTWLLI